MPKKAKPKSGSQKERLEKELTDLLPEIMEEGLLFLIKQANTIIHNQRTVRINREIQELNNNKGDLGVSSEDSSSVEPKKVSDFQIEIERSKSGKNYHFIVNGRKHFFDIPETQKIVALCYRPETKSAALRFLHEFFLNERDEILLEHGIDSAKSPFFERLFYTVRENFTLND